jgi:hypothetical protein
MPSNLSISVTSFILAPTVNFRSLSACHRSPHCGENFSGEPLTVHASRKNFLTSFLQNPSPLGSGQVSSTVTPVRSAHQRASPDAYGPPVGHSQLLDDFSASSNNPSALADSPITCLSVRSQQLERRDRHLSLHAHKVPRLLSPTPMAANNSPTSHFSHSHQLAASSCHSLGRLFHSPPQVGTRLVQCLTPLCHTDIGTSGTSLSSHEAHNPPLFTASSATSTPPHRDPTTRHSEDASSQKRCHSPLSLVGTRRFFTSTDNTDSVSSFAAPSPSSSSPHQEPTLRHSWNHFLCPALSCEIYINTCLSSHSSLKRKYGDRDDADHFGDPFPDVPPPPL